MTIEVAIEGATMDSGDAPPTSEPSSEQPPAPSSDSPAPTPGKTKPANNEEAEDDEEAEEARRQRRSERWGIERVPTIKAKESREPRKRERATGGEAEQVPGSTLEGGRRRCDTCGKTFAERDVPSFRKHVCGRPTRKVNRTARTAMQPPPPSSAF